ncbi:MAG: hypothetical protein ACMXYK_03085, partial [Candidatus Woesearchaeota archaeon]
MIHMKKGQGLSLNTIVIAAIVVLVLIVLSFILVRYVGNFSDDIDNCRVQQGICVDEFDGCGRADTRSEAYP